MTLEDIKDGDEVCMVTFMNPKVVKFIEFLSYNQFLCKYNEEFVIFNVSEICLDDEKILYIKEYIENKDIIKDYYKMAKIFEDRNSELYGLINI